jgi:hypothetical protein
MELSEKIRHRPLSEACTLLAYRNAMQNDPLLLLFLQNVTECMDRQTTALSSLQKDVDDLWTRCGQMARTIEKVRVQHEV